MGLARTTSNTLLLLGLVAGCRAEDAQRGDTVVVRPDASVAPEDAGGKPAPDASLLRDAAADALDRPSKLTVHPRAGAEQDDATAPAGPALVLDSGAPAADVLGWMHAALFSGSAHGDLVVLNAASGNAASALLAAASFRSVQTLSLDDEASASDMAMAAGILDRAEAVWFEGGDQAKYVRWKGSPLMAAVQQVYARGGAVGGSSAGMIILGNAVNDALLTLSENLTSARLLRDPFDPELHFTQNVLQLAPLARTITDPHFSAQDRMGRLAAFMARQVQGAAGFRGIAVDDGVAFAIDRTGLGVRIGAGSGSVYVVRGGVPSQLLAGQPLRYEGLRVRRLNHPSHRYDLLDDCGAGLDYTLDIDGSAEPPYSTDPYQSGTLHSDCPAP